MWNNILFSAAQLPHSLTPTSFLLFCAIKMSLHALAALMCWLSWSTALENCWFWQLPHAEVYLLLWSCHGEWGRAAVRGLAVKHFATIIWECGRYWVCAFIEREFEYREVCFNIARHQKNEPKKRKKIKTGEKCILHTGKHWNWIQ